MARRVVAAGTRRVPTQLGTAFRSFRNARYVLLDFRDRVELHLSGPRPIDRPQGRPKRANIEREVGDQDVVAVEYQAIRPEKTDGRTVLVDPAEVAELGDHPALLRLEHHDLVGLIARDPEVVVLVDDDPVRSAAGAVDEDLGRAGLERRAAHRDLHDRVVRGVGDEQRRLLVVERQTVRADGRRRPRRLEERALDPGGPRAAVFAHFPDNALVRVGHVHVAGGVNGQPIETGVLARDRHEHGRVARHGIDAQDLRAFVIDDEQLARVRMEAKVKQPWR